MMADIGKAGFLMSALLFTPTRAGVNELAARLPLCRGAGKASPGPFAQYKPAKNYIDKLC